MRNRSARTPRDCVSVPAPAREAATPGRIMATLMLAALAAILILGVIAPPAVAAEVEATQTKVSVWPEYDDPRVLVIQEADLTESTDLPASITFNIPKGAEIGMACEVTPAGAHNCKPYKLDDVGDYQALTYTVESNRKLFVEYYYEAFPAAPGDRSFLVDVRPAFPTKSLTLEVQQPARSTDFSTTPELASAGSRSDGLNYFTTEFASPAVGEAIPVSISYVKPDASPSLDVGELDAAGSGGTSAASGAGGRSALLVVVVGMAFAALLLLGYRMFRPAPASGRRSSSLSRRSSSGEGRGGSPGGRRGDSRRDDPKGGGSRAGGSARGKKAGSASGREQSSKFCTQCGDELGADDRFCASCGSPTR